MCFKAFATQIECAILLVSSILIRTRLRQYGFLVTFFYLLTQASIVSVAYHDLIPWMNLDKSFAENLNPMMLSGFLGVSTFFIYDFKYTAFVLVPVYLSGVYF
jgi:hypothetical protein